MPTLRNIFACLVHESQECVIDLVRNLHHLDPSSLILLYNGGKADRLLEPPFPLEPYGVVVHPKPRPMAWGKLHEFALDCLQFAMENCAFDILTIVDSDQLAVRRGYSDYLANFFDHHGDVGLLGSCAGIQTPDTKVGPAAAAFREAELWRPFLRRFQNGEQKFVHWTFWPATVFSADAAKALVTLFTADTLLQDCLQRTRIWATEEVIFPTLTALLGFRIAANPCSYDYVRFRESFTPEQIRAAVGRSDVYWIHPVPRRYDNMIRRQVRTSFNHYTQESPAAPKTSSAGGTQSVRSQLLLHWPILTAMQKIKGWLEEDEADLLTAAASHALVELSEPGAIVEVGSYCGRSTVVLGSVVKALGAEVKVYAIDPHQGTVGALDQGIKGGASTLKMFRRNIAAENLAGVVQEIRQYSFNVKWDRAIGLLLIDGLHDYINVARDFHHFEAWLLPGAYVAFHDYADYYPGVKAFVNEILGSGKYRRVMHVRSLMVVERLRTTELPERSAAAPQPVTGPDRTAWAGRADRQSSAAAPGAALRRKPMVSCVMPTHNRRLFVPRAIEYFVRQDYVQRELLILDDGDDAVADLLPVDPRIRYIRLNARLSLGAKRNMACREACGEIIVHWDDDDWMAAWRLTYQVDELLKAGADLCGLNRVLYYEPGTDRSWHYLYPRRAISLLAGGSLCYLKKFWQGNPFPEINLGEDARFVWSDRPKKLLALENNRFYIALIHAGNTNPRNTAGWRWRPARPDTVRNLIGEDLTFYGNLFKGREPARNLSDRSPPARIEICGGGPLVSCIMPTDNRRMFVPRAIAYFRRQTYANKELIIVDDGRVDLSGAIPHDDRIRYLRLDRQANLGCKRNFAVQASRGDIIAHWDDDDWYAPDRLDYQVRAMTGAAAELCGLDTGFFYDTAEDACWACSTGLHAKMFFADINGRSIMYARKLWEEYTHYPEVPLAEDALFLGKVLKRNVKMLKLANNDTLIYIRHRANVWRFACGKFMDPKGWQRLNLPDFLPSQDLSFYQGLQQDQSVMVAASR